jgi:hypothetical protein
MNDTHDTARQWIANARDAGVSARLEAIYAGVAREIEARAPACWASGRCCNFDKAGHLLYVTGLEAAYTLVRHAKGGVEAARPGVVTLTQVKPIARFSSGIRAACTRSSRWAAACISAIAPRACGRRI